MKPKEIIEFEEATKFVNEESDFDFNRRVEKEICAMSNSAGGLVIIGMRDNLDVKGIEDKEIHLFNLWIASAANEKIKPAIYPQTQIIVLEDKKVLLVRVPEGRNKPYCDHKGIYWVKLGSEVRSASPRELIRQFQESKQIYLDILPVQATIQELDKPRFFSFFERNFNSTVSESGLGLAQILRNMNLAKDQNLTLGGLLLFGENVLKTKPFCMIRAVSFKSNDIADDLWIDKRDCTGTLEEQFRSALTFLKNNLRNIQTGNSFNSPGTLEIHEKALEEALVNALIHRDYSKNAVIRLFVFLDRVELISPGSLPNHLTVANIISGNSVIRNPVITSYGTKILPYSGIGSGIVRILKHHPDTQLFDDKSGEQFKITLKRS